MGSSSWDMVRARRSLSTFTLPQLLPSAHGRGRRKAVQFGYGERTDSGDRRAAGNSGVRPFRRAAGIPGLSLAWAGGLAGEVHAAGPGGGSTAGAVRSGRAGGPDAAGAGRVSGLLGAAGRSVGVPLGAFCAAADMDGAAEAAGGGARAAPAVHGQSGGA